MKSWHRKLRMGMVGGGQGAFIGGVHRLAAQMDQHVELAAGCFSRDYENTLKTGKDLYLDESRCYPDYETMIKEERALPERKRIDFVSVVTTNETHYEISKAFLEAGIHVVCDKPMTYSLEQAEDLVKIVEKSGLVFGLTHNYTGNPMVREARQICRGGKLGKVRKVIVQYLQDALSDPLEREGQKQIAWRVDPNKSGIVGAMGDVGTHAENLLEYITGEKVTELCADFSTFLPDRKLDEDANLLIRLSGGGKGVITVSQICVGEENNLRIKIYAENGAIIWEQENPNYLYVYWAHQPRETLTRGRSEYLSQPASDLSRVPTGHPEGYLEAFANVYRDIIEAIRFYIDGKPIGIEDYKFPTVYDGLRGMRFITKAAESAKMNSTWKKL